MTLKAANSNATDALSREQQRARFLARSPYFAARLVQLGSDASIRQYFRLEEGPQPALLMDAPSAALTPPCPPGADKKQRLRLGYSALVRGSGNSIVAYTAASRILSGLGLIVPRVIDSDSETGFAIIEDLGSERVADAASSRMREAELYHLAADSLDLLRSQPASAGRHHGWHFQTYDRLAYRTEVELLVDWYIPHRFERRVDDIKRHRLDEAWCSVFGDLSPPRHYCHRDYHAENLMVVGHQIGVLDFQDLMVGQAAYDWVSLIEDTRRDLDKGLAEDLYLRGYQCADDPAAFRRDYAILAAQRNAKILGLFARLAQRDGKKRYLSLLDRVESFFKDDLKRPDVAPVAEALADIVPELTA
ncbi:MAG: phosphotransferase [Pseudomonadota bacterium]